MVPFFTIILRERERERERVITANHTKNHIKTQADENKLSVEGNSTGVTYFLLQSFLT